jgi:flagellar hook-associated protein 2
MLERVFSQDLFNTFYTGVGESIDYNGQKYETKVTYSLTDLGFSLNRTGMISFDEDKFRSFYSEHPDVTQNLITSAFSKVKEDFSRYATDDNSVLNILDRQIKDEEKSYQDRIDSLNKFLDARYNTMAMQFAQYDEMINQLNTQSSSLMMVIEQTINSKS